MLLSELIIPDKNIILPEDYQLFTKPIDHSMSQRKLDRYIQIAKIKAYENN